MLEFAPMLLTAHSNGDVRGSQLARDTINSAATHAVLAEPSEVVTPSDILFEHCRFLPADLLNFILTEEKIRPDGKEVHKVIGDSAAITTLLKRGPSAIRAVRFSSSCVLIIVADSQIRAEPGSAAAKEDLEEICGVVVPSYHSAEPVFGELPQERAIGMTEWRVNDQVTLVCLAEQRGGTVQLFRDVNHLPRNHDVLREGGGDLLAVTAVDIREPVNTAAFDAWLSCCLHGSPTCLVFFFDDQVCKGVEFVYATALPTDLPILVAKYQMSQPRIGADTKDKGEHIGGCGVDSSAKETPLAKCFEPDEWRERAQEFVQAVSRQEGEPGCAWKALLFYRAAVRLAQGNKRMHPDAAREVPQGVRWTALSMGSPFRVRHYMAKAMKAAPEHFHLLRASALEFTADSYLALPGEAVAEKEESLLEVIRCLSESLAILLPDDDEPRLRQRLISKSVNARVMLAKSYQRASPPRLGEAIKQIDAALAIETNTLLCASFSHLKAVLLGEFVLQYQDPGCDRDYMLAQASLAELDTPAPKLDPERWLYTSVTLCLKAVRLAESHPLAQSVIAEAKATVSLSYMALGKLYASSGRYTKCHILARQGIELFSATGDWEQALKLQMWQGNVRLGWIHSEVEDASFLSASTHNIAEQTVERVKKAMSPVEDGPTLDTTRAFLCKLLLSLGVSMLPNDRRVFCSLSQPSDVLSAAKELVSKDEDFDVPPEFTEKVTEALHVIEKLRRRGHRLENVANLILEATKKFTATADKMTYMTKENPSTK
eukprot:GEMP01015423.1.p1 GENE.GEMP01015423.1~~GEMP01015423.1.p1  ORF type:complete len:772 (+),score=172.62 GEMP01015423.1:169-2484(+)